MAEQFRDCFVGEKGYDALRKLMKDGNEFSREFVRCIQERNDAEIAYTRALRKHSDSLQKLAGRATKGSLMQALTTLATQTSKEGDAHSMLADVLLKDIAIPVKNLAETQSKEFKSVEESLNGKFREWNARKADDNKYRSRQFEKCKEIEALYVRISEASKTGKSSSKDSTKERTLPATLVRGCVRPTGHYATNTEKTTATLDVKHQAYLESTIKKTEEELESTDKKYHTATRDVEIARQACDVEMCRSCDQLQKMELDRITEIGSSITALANTMQSVSETMHQVSGSLDSIQVIPQNDIVAQARSNFQKPEMEILLYDIYAENMDNPMSDLRRKQSLIRWKEILEGDVDRQRQSKHVSSASLSSTSSRKHESPDDDLCESSDGAMCSTSSRSKKGHAAVNFRNDSPPSSNNDDDDGDGGMYHAKAKKREKKRTEETEKFSSERFIDRHSVELLLCLYEASLYKIECAYNRMMGTSQPQYEYAGRLTITSNDKGYRTTLLRVPFQPPTHTPPSAPPATKFFVHAMPMFPASMMEAQPVLHTMQQAPPVGWAVADARQEHIASDNSRVTSEPPCAPAMTRSAEFPQGNRVKHVRVKYPYKATRNDELNIKKDDIIILLETRKDGWCQGNLNNKVGLFPANFVEDV